MIDIKDMVWVGFCCGIFGFIVFLGMVLGISWVRTAMFSFDSYDLRVCVFVGVIFFFGGMLWKFLVCLVEREL